MIIKSALAMLLTMAAGGIASALDDAPIQVENNPVPFVMPTDPAYYQAQDLSAASVRKLKNKVSQILADAGNPTEELEKVKTLCNWVATNLHHPYFNGSIKRRVHDPEYDKFAHDPAKILEYTEKAKPFNPATWPAPECTQQNDVLIGLLNTIGLHGRIHNITGHVAGEYYSPTFRKWVYVDSTFNELYEDSRNPGIPISTIEMINMSKNNQTNSIKPVKCGEFLKSSSYIKSFPKGFNCAFNPKMWMATFDQGEKANKKANLIVYGKTDMAFLKPYPKAALADSVDFPLGLIRIKGAVLRGDGWAFVKLENCIPYFSHYEYKSGDEKWQKAATDSDYWNAAKKGSRKYRGVDNAGNLSPVIEVIIK
jgi:hypothetical protein